MITTQPAEVERMTELLSKAAIAAPALVVLVVLVYWFMRHIREMQACHEKTLMAAQREFGDRIAEHAATMRDVLKSRDERSEALSTQCHAVQNRTLDELGKFSTAAERLSTSVTELGRRMREGER